MEPALCEIRELDYFLPEGLIAQHPAPRREAARLLVVPRRDGALRDLAFTDFPMLLRKGDLLVLNDTKVLPAKFVARRKSGGRVEGLFLAEESPGVWRVLLKGAGRLCGRTLEWAHPSHGVITMALVEPLGEGAWRVALSSAQPAALVLDQAGRTPLPPYIHRSDAGDDLDDRSRYQTVYAQVPGAVAAPTAGLHFTESLLAGLRGKGVDIETVTLHVGVGTFKPMTASRWSHHRMHGEFVDVSEKTAAAVHACRERGGRVVAVGTTTVRALESAARRGSTARFGAFRGVSDLFIYPPFTFRAVDALLTNFHLPKSTLLALVAAFAGLSVVQRAYRHAVESRYRFYSYGDAMFLA
jgi:S-adenosylmethionine:tRNA ribosyltransferase-isomerase